MPDSSEDSSANRVAESLTHRPISTGIVYTFIHETFEGESFVPRKGADEDFNNIERCFRSLDLTVMPPYIDFSALEVLNTLRAASESDFSDYDCLVVIIITHYEKYGELMTKAGCYYENQVIDFFKGDKCSGLVTKPKIFLFQSSRCQQLRRTKLKSHTEADSSGEPVRFTLPTEADILALRSSYEGGPSHKPEDSGSWVVQSLCERLEGLTGNTLLSDALAAFLNQVAHNREKTNILSQVDYKYLPEVTSTMTQSVLFKNSSLKSENVPQEFYKRYKNMGKVFIFNYNNVYNKPGRNFLKRDGTDIDANSLESCFKNLGFQVIRENDLTKEEVFRILLSAKDFAEDTCVAVVVLTHGIEGNLGTYDIPFSEEELYKPFSDKRQPDLIGKPKFFFLQVCRGDTVTGSVQVDKTPQGQAEYNLVSDLNEGQIMADEDITTDSSDIQLDGPTPITTLSDRENIAIDIKTDERFQTQGKETKTTLLGDSENTITLIGSSVIPIQSEETHIIGGEERAMTTPDREIEGLVETDAAPSVVTVAGKAVPQAQIKTMADPLDEDDTLVFHSTYAGTPSHRHIIMGSWFIQNLCGVLQSKTQPFSFVDALYEVQNKVAINEEENIANQLHKQMPVVCSTLTKSLMVSVVPKPK